MTPESLSALCTDCWGGMRYRQREERAPLGPPPPPVIYLPAHPAPEPEAEAPRPEAGAVTAGS